MNDYYKKLLDPRWQKIKRTVLARDNETCRICKSTKDTLHVHHELYVNDPWDAPIGTLKTLCFRCHEVVEVCKKSKIKYRNINRVQKAPEKFVYVVNTKIDTFGKNGKYAYIVHNLAKSSDAFVVINFCFPLDFVEFMLDTF